MQLLNAEGRVASLDPMHPWTITSAQWNSLKTKTRRGQTEIVQGRALVERLHVESQVQERLERQGVRCRWWRECAGTGRRGRRGWCGCWEERQRRRCEEEAGAVSRLRGADGMPCAFGRVVRAWRMKQAGSGSGCSGIRAGGLGYGF